MRKLALLMLALVSVAGAQVKPLSLPSGKVWVKGKTVQLLNKAGKRVWGTQISGGILDLLSAQGKVLVNQDFGVAVLDAKTGHVLWQTYENGVIGNLDVQAVGPARDWGAVGNQLYWSYTLTNGTYMAQGTSIYALGSGKKIGEIGGSPWLEQGGLIFFVPDSPAPPLSHPQVLEVTIWNPKLALSAVQQMSYVIPSRPKCGLLSEEPADYANEISGPYLRARRADNCGLFVARVKWAQPSYTKPELLPPK